MSGAKKRTDSTPLRVGVIGGGGQLGRCLVRALEASADHELAFATSRAELDLARTEELEQRLVSLLGSEAALGLHAVVNAAAHTKVDACESETELAYQVNALAPGSFAQALAARDIGFVHVSTDYVFPGDGDRPYREDDSTDPRTVYGSSKRAGEMAVLGHHPDALVVRTSWVFGPGRNFVAAILEQGRKRRTGELSGPLRVVSDQRGTPTYAKDLADGVLSLLGRANPEAKGDRVKGLLHLRNGGETTWFEFARAILDAAGFADLPIDPVTTDAFPTPAQRPAYSVLDVSRASSLGVELPSWTDALSRYLAGPDRPEGWDPIGAAAAPSEACAAPEPPEVSR